MVMDIQLQGQLITQPSVRTSGRRGRSTKPQIYTSPSASSIQFNLSSPDVIHSFWVPSFYEKLDVIPGRHNSLQMRPTAEGIFAGKCAELCGTYHSAMLFNVHVVSENDYNTYLKIAGRQGPDR